MNRDSSVGKKSKQAENKSYLNSRSPAVAAICLMRAHSPVHSRHILLFFSCPPPHFYHLRVLLQCHTLNLRSYFRGCQVHSAAHSLFSVCFSEMNPPVKGENPPTGTRQLHLDCIFHTVSPKSYKKKKNRTELVAGGAIFIIS